MHNPRNLVPATVEHTEVGSCVENGTHEVKKDAKKKPEHLYPAMSRVTLPLSTAQHFFNTALNFYCLDSQAMESDNSLPVSTDIEFDFPRLTPSTLRQPIAPVVTFFSAPSTTHSLIKPFFA